MVRFFEWIINNRYAPEYYFPTHHGRNRMFSSPHSNLFITYNDCEMDEINQLYNEARIIIDAEKILAAKA